MTLDALFDDVRNKRKWKSKGKQQFDFSQALKAEKQYAIQLRRIVRHIYNIVHNSWQYSIAATLQIRDMLARYSALIEPWARSVTQRMHVEVATRNLKEWERYSKVMGVEIQREIRQAPTGEALRLALNQQVHLIKSIPRDIAERVHELTMKGLIEGTRADEIQTTIMESVKNLARWKATLIARTETARTASLYTQTRAQAIGLTHYRWTAVHDPRTRRMHRELDGTIQRFDEPPIAEANGERHHPGMFPNCRCWMTPVGF